MLKPGANRSIAVPFRASPIADDLRLVLGSAGFCGLLSAAQTELLLGFTSLRPEAEAGLQGSDHDVALLKALGLLVEEERVLAKYRTPNHERETTSIGSVAIPTYGRPSHLANCVGTFLNNAHAHGHDVTVVVADGSSSPTDRAQNILKLRELSKKAEIRYCGPEQRKAFWKALRAQGVGLAAIWAAAREMPLPCNFGAARNTLMLDHAGEAFLSVDDDTVARTAVHPSRKDGIRLVGGGRCFDYWFFRGRSDAVQWAQWVTLDIVGEHAALLGRSVRSLLAPAAQPVYPERMCGHFAEPGWDPRLVGTMAGKVGDSGRRDPHWDIWIGNWAQDRDALGRLDLAELPESTAIGHDVPCMTTVAGIDFRSILPPFFPWYRGEDELFGALISRVMPDACWGIVPHGILHDRPLRGRWAPVQLLGPCEVVRALILGLPSRRDGRSDAEAIQEAGADLRILVEGDPRRLRQIALERVGTLVAHGSAILRRAREGAQCRSQHVVLTAAWEKLLLEFRRMCDPDSEIQLPGASWSGFVRQLAAYGQLLQAWPAIYQAVRELRSAGIRPSVDVNRLSRSKSALA